MKKLIITVLLISGCDESIEDPSMDSSETTSETGFEEDGEEPLTVWDAEGAQVGVWLGMDGWGYLVWDETTGLIIRVDPLSGEVSAPEQEYSPSSWGGNYPDCKWDEGSSFIWKSNITPELCESGGEIPTPSLMIRRYDGTFARQVRFENQPMWKEDEEGNCVSLGIQCQILVEPVAYPVPFAGPLDIQ